jgi:pimeloyl-ACP methyl ester carboxylesterase
MDHIESQINLSAAKFYLLGVSNGGISAFRVATLNPERFHSVTVLPGWPKPADEKRLETLINVPINFLVGELDGRWRAKSELFVDKILSLGGDAKLEVIPGQGHMAFQTISAQRLIQIMQRI